MPDDLDRIVQVSEPQLTPDGKAIVIVVARVNVAANRYDRDLVLVDVASREQRVLVSERSGVGHRAGRRTGDRLAFLAKAGGRTNTRSTRSTCLPMNGGEARRSRTPRPACNISPGSPTAQQLAFAAPTSRKKGEPDDDIFEVGNDNVFSTSAAHAVAHVADRHGSDGAQRAAHLGKLESARDPAASSPSVAAVVVARR